MSKYIFITGTNTDVGKTFIGIKLIKHLMKIGYLAFKPIETGCTKRGNVLTPSDSTKYYSALNNKVSLNKINPYRFIEPISPYLAIKREKKRIYLKNYIDKLKDLEFQVALETREFDVAAALFNNPNKWIEAYNLMKNGTDLEKESANSLKTSILTRFEKQLDDQMLRKLQTEEKK